MPVMLQYVELMIEDLHLFAWVLICHAEIFPLSEDQMWFIHINTLKVTLVVE